MRPLQKETEERRERIEIKVFVGCVILKIKLILVNGSFYHTHKEEICPLKRVTGGKVRYELIYKT